MNQYKNLFESIEINGLTLENRLVMTPWELILVNKMEK